MSNHAGIITLQVGNYANYVGTHLWNLQDRYHTQLEEQQTVSQSPYWANTV
jgi:hypothetical protein